MTTKLLELQPLPRAPYLSNKVQTKALEVQLKVLELQALPREVRPALGPRFLGIFNAFLVDQADKEETAQSPASTVRSRSRRQTLRSNANIAITGSMKAHTTRLIAVSGRALLWRSPASCATRPVEEQIGITVWIATGITTRSVSNATSPSARRWRTNPSIRRSQRLFHHFHRESETTTEMQSHLVRETLLILRLI